RPEGAQYRDKPVLRCAELPRVLAPHFGLIDERSRDDLQVAVTRTKSKCEPIDRAGGRIVADEVGGKLGCHEPCRGWMPAQRPDSALTLGDAVLLVTLPEHDLRPRLVQQFLK